MPVQHPTLEEILETYSHGLPAKYLDTSADGAMPAGMLQAICEGVHSLPAGPKKCIPHATRLPLCQLAVPPC